MGGSEERGEDAVSLREVEAAVGQQQGRRRRLSPLADRDFYAVSLDAITPIRWRGAWEVCEVRLVRIQKRRFVNGMGGLRSHGVLPTRALQWLHLGCSLGCGLGSPSAWDGLPRLAAR
jgi:hypothetical protein